MLPATQHYDRIHLSAPQDGMPRHSLTAVDIPDDVLDRIFHFLPPKDRARCPAVCKSWADRPWDSISLACTACWCEEAHLQWLYTVALRSSSTLRAVQLHFQDIDRSKVRSMMTCISTLTRLTFLDLGYKNPAFRITPLHLMTLAPLANLETMVCTLALSQGYPALRPGEVRRATLQEFGRFACLQHLAVSFCRKKANQRDDNPSPYLLLESEDFLHLKTLRLDSLSEIHLNPAIRNLVARLEELEVTNLTLPIAKGELEAPLMRRFTYDYGHHQGLSGNQYPLTATRTLQELTWHGDSLASVLEASKLGKLTAIKLRFCPDPMHFDEPGFSTGYVELRDLELPSLRSLKLDSFDVGPPFVLYAFLRLSGQESLDICYSPVIDIEILPAYGVLENLQFLKITTFRADLDSGLQFLRALKVLHLDIRHIKGQLESKSLEVLKLTCHTMEHSKPKANLGPLGYLPQLNTVEIKARLTTRTEVFALAYGLGCLGNLRNIVVLRKPAVIDGEREKTDVDFLEIILQGLSNRQSHFDRIVLLDTDAICSLRRYDWMDDTVFLRLRLSEVGHPGIASMVENLKQLKSHTTTRSLKSAPWDRTTHPMYDIYQEYVEIRGEDSGLTPECSPDHLTPDSEIVGQKGLILP